MELRIEHLTKRFKDKVAVNDVSITLTPGIWGLLGANGAGKTTLMRMIADIMTPTDGAVYFDGEDIRKMGERYRDAFGILPQEFGYPKEFTVVDYLEYMAALKGISKEQAPKKIDNLLNILTLADVKRKKIKKLSGGMRRRVGIAQAVLNDPKILILDEPTAGLDPGERIKFRNYISEFAHNRIVLVSTHIVSDVEHIANKIAIMRGGEIVEVGTNSDLLDSIKGKVWSVAVPPVKISEIEKKIHVINQQYQDNGLISFRYLADTPQVEGSTMVSPRLEDLYLWLFPNYDTEVV